MKKTIFSILFLLVSFISTHAQYRYGIEAGGNLNYTAVNSTQGAQPTTSLYIGYKAGALLDLDITENVGVQLGLYYTVLGYKYKYSESSDDGGTTINESINSTTQENFLRLPINVVFRKPLGGGTFFIAVGPFLGYGLNGKVSGTYHADITKNGATTTVDTPYGGGVSFSSKALDYGICASIGYQLPAGLFIRAGYDLSLAGLQPVEGFGTQTNSCLSISLGFLFTHESKNRHHSFDTKVKYLPKPYNHLSYP